MKLLLDQGIPRGAAPLLRAAGVDCIHTGEIGLARAVDDVIIEQARQDGRLVVTFDADFHAIMALTGATNPSVIRIRIERLTSEDIAMLILNLIRRFATELQSGVLLTAQPNRVRLHFLPIV